MNKLSIIIDHFLEINEQETENYKRHLRGAKQILELCEGNIDKALELLDNTKEWIENCGYESWTIETCVKYYCNNLLTKRVVN